MNNNYLGVICDQGSPEWHRARCGSLTASKASILLDGTVKAKNNLMDELEAALLAGATSERKFFSSAMEWGKQNEDRARAVYNLHFPNMSACGFFIHGSYPLIGASPDGVLMSTIDGKVLGGLEIKCPYNPSVHESHRMGTIAPAYVWQIQFSMWLLGAAFWDFMSFDPRRDGDGQLHFRRFNRDESIMRRIEKEVQDWQRHRQSGSRYKEAATPLELMTAGVLPKFF